MGALSQIVGEYASPFANILSVEDTFPAWQSVPMAEDGDKNGGPNNLRAWREYRKLTQEGLATTLNTSANMIQYLESGDRGLSLKWLRRLAPALDTTPGFLADYAPAAINMEMHDLFTKRKLTDEQMRQLIAIADALVKTGTNDQ